jgi:hypothetical protein
VVLRVLLDVVGDERTERDDGVGLPKPRPSRDSSTSVCVNAMRPSAAPVGGETDQASAEAELERMQFCEW